MGYKRKEYENMEGLFTNGKKKFVKYDEGAAMYSMGIHAFTELAKEAKAIYRIRRIVLVNTEIIDEYMENFRDICQRSESNLPHQEDRSGKYRDHRRVYGELQRHLIVIFLRINSRRPQNSPMRCHTEGTA